MTVKLKPADEALIEKRLRSGEFKSVEDVIHYALASWANLTPQSTQPQQAPRSLSQFLMESPLAGSELNLDRDRDPGRAVEL